MAKKKNQQKFTTYSNLTKNKGKSRRTIKKEGKARERAEYLATLPKNPVLRFLVVDQIERLVLTILDRSPNLQFKDQD